VVIKKANNSLNNQKELLPKQKGTEND
jgi:hypothetical protein